jgi:hypothetical protein
MNIIILDVKVAIYSVAYWMNCKANEMCETKCGIEKNVVFVEDLIGEQFYF